MRINRKFIQQAVLNLHGEGHPPKAISHQSGIPLTTVRRWIAQHDPARHAANVRRAAEQRRQKSRDMRATVALRKRGLAPALIADELELRLRRVNNLLADYRSNASANDIWPTLGDGLRSQIAQHRQDGLYIRAIATRTGKAVGTVHYHLKKLGMDGVLERDTKSSGSADGTGPDVEPRPRKTGRAAEAETHALLMHVAEDTQYRIRPIYPSLDDRYDMLLAIESYTLMVQVRTAKFREGYLSASIRRSKGEPYRADTCDLLFGYDERTHTLYCRLGRDVWTRRASIALRAEDAVTRAAPQKVVELIEQALADKLGSLKMSAGETA